MSRSTQRHSTIIGFLMWCAASLSIGLPFVRLVLEWLHRNRPSGGMDFPPPIESIRWPLWAYVSAFISPFLWFLVTRHMRRCVEPGSRTDPLSQSTAIAIGVLVAGGFSCAVWSFFTATR